jgi:hypothetical protein
MVATISIDVPKHRGNGTSKKGTPAALNWGRLVAEGRAARSGADAGRWRIGHLATLVAKQYGARSLQNFADDIGESYSTVRRYRWVATRYEPTVRFRFQQLSFSHFQAVAGLPDREKWLARAEHGCWSVDELVRQSRPSAEPARASKGSDRQAEARAVVSDARAQLRRIRSLGDAEIAKASSWLEPLLDDLTAEIDRVRNRVQSVRGVRLGKYRTHANGNGNGARARSVGRGSSPPRR